jgi:hypothetical protein
MASIGSLLSRGSLIPDGAGGWKLELSTKFKWDEKKFRRLEGKARMKALSRAGLRVKQSCQKQISARKPLSKNPKQWQIATRHGFDLIALVDRPSKPDQLTSWRTPRNPSGMLRKDIENDYDGRSQSVVVGPSKFPWLNQLHEFGGTSKPRYFLPIPRRTRGNRVFGVLTNTRPTVGRGGRRRVEQAGVYSFTPRIKARPFMSKGLAAARRKIPEEFRDQLRGP